jgi:NADPH:quinone reductase
MLKQRAFTFLSTGKLGPLRHTRIIVNRYGGADAIEVLEEECPEPKRGEVRVKVLAAALPDITWHAKVFTQKRQRGHLPGHRSRCAELD